MGAAGALFLHLGVGSASSVSPLTGLPCTSGESPGSHIARLQVIVCSCFEALWKTQLLLNPGHLIEKIKHSI